WIASANVIADCVARASTIGSASCISVTSRARMAANHAADRTFVQGFGMAKPAQERLELAGFEVGISNPDKIYFPDAGITKRELVQYYLAVAEGALRGVANRPM